MKVMRQLDELTINVLEGLVVIGSRLIDSDVWP